MRPNSARATDGWTCESMIHRAANTFEAASRPCAFSISRSSTSRFAINPFKSNPFHVDVYLRMATIQPVRPVAPALTGTLAGPAVALHDIDLNDNDVKTPLKGPRVGQEYYVQKTAVVEQRPRFDFLDCLVCWYCPGVFLISRVFLNKKFEEPKILV